MMLREILVDQRVRRLGRQVGKGGEGAVFQLADDEGLAVKLYTVRDLASREAKVSSMVRAGLAARAPLVAFPLSIARDPRGVFAGFVMKLVGGHKPLHEIYAPGPRKIHFPQADYRFLVRVAANVARAVASVHRSNCVIGDINHSGLLVSPKAVVALIDADSFQVTDGGQRFLCKVGVPEYTPPELQGMALGSVERTPNHDAFGLAVVIFQLLFMGRHPFVGTVRRGDIPPLHENIKNFRYVYAENRDVGMDQPPGTPSVADISPGIADFFERAFSRDTLDRRPTAEQWIPRLEALEASLVKCDDNPLHYTPKEANECPWCEMESALGSYLFVPSVGAFSAQTPGPDPGAASFSLERVWARIEAVQLPTSSQKQPPLQLHVAEPSAAARAAKTPKVRYDFVKIAVAAIAVFALVAAPALFLLWGFVLLWALGDIKREQAVDSSPFKRAFDQADADWKRELASWEKRAGIEEITRLRYDLSAARDEYRRLDVAEQQAIARYREERRARQLSAYLDGFDIVHTKISGVGPAKLAALASYGIDTAADIEESKLLAVPGFGPATSKPLLDWRRKLEARFSYNPAENDVDRRELARIRGANLAKAAALRAKLIGGVEQLQSAARKVADFIGRVDPAVQRSHAAREQAKVDLECLGLGSYILSGGAAGQTTATVRTGSSTARQGGTASSCPRCGSAMVRRLARRGTNAGNYFWGCSRYPRCKGTRS